MSQENLLKLSNFDESQIPERDSSDMKPVPRPRVRKSIELEQSEISKFSYRGGGGVDNESFIPERDIPSEKDHNLPQPKPRTTKSAFMNTPISSDSDLSEIGSSRKSNNTIVAAVNVHHHPDSTSDTTIEKKKKTNEKKSNSNLKKKNKPKASQKKKQISSDESSEEDEEKKEDYLAITMPQIESDGKKENNEEKVKGHTKRKGLGLINKWRSTAKSIFQSGGSTSNTSLPMVESKNAKEGGSNKGDTIVTIESSESSSDLSYSSEDSEVLKKERKNKREKDKKSERLKSANSKSSKKENISEIEEQNDDDDEEERDKLSLNNKRRAATATKLKKIKTNNKISTKKLFTVEVHYSDLYVKNRFFAHPVVRIRVLDQRGHFLKSDQLLSNNPHKKGSESTLQTTSNIHKAIQDIITIPGLPGDQYFLEWNDFVLFPEQYAKFIDNSNVIVFFEIMDTLPIQYMEKYLSMGTFGTDPCWIKFAWAFLKPGANGSINYEKRVRLQLYEPCKLKLKDRIRELPEVYSWWASEKLKKLDGSLYVTIHGVESPILTTKNLMHLIEMRNQQMAKNFEKDPSKINENDRENIKKIVKNASKKIDTLKKYTSNIPNWRRLEGQGCKPPNKLLLSLPASNEDSSQYNIVVSGNVYCVKFSPCGQFLAAGLDSNEFHTVLIFEIPSGNLLKVLKGHYGLIYSLDWKLIQNEEYDEECLYVLASASADSISSIWIFDYGQLPKLFRKLLHPSFVYCVKFHPTFNSIVATGCYDFLIRFWNLELPQATSEELSNVHEDISPIIILDDHSSYINCLEFNDDGTNLFSGDGHGIIYIWSLQSSSTKKKMATIKNKLELTEKNRPVNSISMHPKANRLLVHYRESNIKLVDLDSFIVLHNFPGVVNDRLQIKSGFSPCGNLVLSGSEDSTICIWDSDTGSILQFIRPEKHPNCNITSVDYHPHDFYLAAGISSSILLTEPNPILLYTFHSAANTQKKLSISDLAKLKVNFSRKRKSRQSTASTLNRLDSLAEIDNESFKSGKSTESTEKFVKIIKKLDTALKIIKENKGVDESSTQNIISNSMINMKSSEIVKLNELIKSVNDHKGIERNPIEKESSSSIVVIKQQEPPRSRHASDSKKNEKRKLSRMGKLDLTQSGQSISPSPIKKEIPLQIQKKDEPEENKRFVTEERGGRRDTLDSIENIEMQQFSEEY